MWVPVCVLGVISGFILFVGFNLTSDKYPDGGCPKMLLRIFSYQMNEYFTPMDDEMVAELCKKPIVQPTEDIPIKDEPTEEIDAVCFRIPKKHSTDKSTYAVKIVGPSSDKVPDLIEPVRTPDEQKTSQTEEIQDTMSYPQLRLTSPSGKIVDIPKRFIAKDLQGPKESNAKEIDERSPDADALVKEIRLNSSAMFTPYISPLFYLSHHTYKPAVIVQNLIRKSDFTDLIRSSFIFRPYIDPFLFPHLNAIDYLTTDEIESRQIVDRSTKNEQVSENLPHSKYCEVLRDYYDCHFQNLQFPNSLCGKEFSLELAHDLMTKLCTEYILKYVNSIRCAKTAVQEDFEYCKIESESLVEKYKKYIGTEVFEADENFESCIKSVFRNKCFSLAIEKKCVTEDFLSHGDLLSKSGAQFHCKNQEEYSRALEAAKFVQMTNRYPYE
ncbi:uncharacterized protein TNIN_5561 [Trichonephila inaurata madagascariensis]|uniref:Uncharacterized protein n=1 Tax=Trichonephila inaurata madagascariensis TaxID=2747483 RepID=A0A8X6YBN5_9ARAC|nr:uncharacterized protein TNIN_5561 [Trichonephila inaurata madagascariensis]